MKQRRTKRGDRSQRKCGKMRNNKTRSEKCLFVRELLRRRKSEWEASVCECVWTCTHMCLLVCKVGKKTALRQRERERGRGKEIVGVWWVWRKRMRRGRGGWRGKWMRLPGGFQSRGKNVKRAASGTFPIESFDSSSFNLAFDSKTKLWNNDSRFLWSRNETDSVPIELRRKRVSVQLEKLRRRLTFECERLC